MIPTTTTITAIILLIPVVLGSWGNIYESMKRNNPRTTNISPKLSFDIINITYPFYSNHKFFFKVLIIP